jgi:protein-L-isoaspartate(D-aspartate) O-methyltransferase
MDDPIGFFTSREDLLKRLKEETKVFTLPEIEKAFRAIDRADFMPGDYMVEAYEDYPVPIGFDQTISQPTTVAFMLEQLGVMKGETVLDVGSGSGYTTALLAELVGEKGKVLGLEIVPELVEEGRKNLAKYKFKNARIEQAGKKFGDAKSGPYDRILVNAAAEETPHDLLQQLGPEGVLVVPIKESIWRFEKTPDGEIESKEFPGFVFVPLI